MNKSMSGRLFFSFILLVTAIFAVLELVIGQLFPFYLEDYVQVQTEVVQENVVEFIQQENIELTSLQQEKLLQAYDVSADEEYFSYTRVRLMLVLVILFLVAIAVIGLVSYRMVSNFVEPIEAVTRTAQELAVGNYYARAFANGPKTIIELRNSINVLARNLQDITKIREIEEERLKTLIENMGSALMMIDREGYISIVNKQFLHRFGLTSEQVQGKNFLTVGLPENLEVFIDHVFLTEQPYQKQLEMELQQEITYKLVYGAPVVGEHGRWLGVVLVMHDVTELIRLEQIRRDFVANVSHELRTPITSIKGFSETLLDGAYKDENMLLSFLEIIYKESNRLQELINDLLELSKIEQHGFSVDIAPTSLQEVIARVVDVTSPRLEEKNMQFDMQMDRDVRILGDENRLIQIFTNLISNAVTYSPDSTTITVKMTQNEEYGIVEVEDQGIGIEKQEIARVFERFYRIDRARSRNSGGTGLGLAIVKHLVEAHHGKIVVTSEVGKGTKISIHIPLAPSS
ncbi:MULTISPECIES: ATP-binding protein [Metasolibacillus]|uniref:two-component system histidine kinase PnpS n=1 Tax=Metasolibacillus TaxID=2703677 RepID=UPI0007957D7B|nr:ATP-binding protein [Metasolibacillus fluoroglycofenilyticus]KYG91534.1 PAS domain-containing sensor histidine kinase [[Bacillus] sp. KCTC 13219]